MISPEKTAAVITNAIGYLLERGLAKRVEGDKVQLDEAGNAYVEKELYVVSGGRLQ